MDNKPTKVKAAVSSKVVVVGVVIAVVVGLSLVTASLITPAQIGNFYAGSGDIPKTPACPIGDYANNGTGVYDCVDDSLGSPHGIKNCIGGEDGVLDQYACYRDKDGNASRSTNDFLNSGDVCCLVEPPLCPPTHSQCGDGDNAACCGANETCESTRNPLPPWNKIYFCKPSSCPDPAKPKLCSGSKNNACCAADAICGESGLGVAYCKDSGCTNPNCGDICCDSDEVCVNKTGLPPTCQPKDSNSCGEGEEFCRGTGDYADRERCCPKGDCYVMPN